MTDDQPRTANITRGGVLRDVRERHTTDEPHTGDFGPCPFCHQPLGNLPTEAHPYFGIEIDLDQGDQGNKGNRTPDATCVYECLDEERKEP